MNRRAIVVTHHKTGTVWMKSTFKSICKILKVRLVDTLRRDMSDPSDYAAPIVLLQSHTGFGGNQGADRRNIASWMLTDPECRIFHLIRDPRDVLISAMHFHRVAKEQWLHKPLKRFGGLTYQQKINSLSDDRERYLFELDNSAGRVAEEMRNWNYKLPVSFECKYEELVIDRDASLFVNAAVHLGFSDDELDVCKNEFWKSSIFGGKAENKGATVHIRSGDARQWSAKFDRELATVFVKRFGNILIELGYEKDNKWIETLPELPAKVH